MLVKKDHVAGEPSCWWERTMLVKKDHVGGKRVMWLLQDSKLLQKEDFCIKKLYFFTERTPVCPFAT